MFNQKNNVSCKVIENNARCFQCMYHFMYRPNLPGFPRKVKCQKHSNPTNKWYINSDSFPSGLVNDMVPLSMVLLSFWRMSAGDRAAVWGVNGRIQTCRAQSKLEVLILPNIAAFGQFGPLPWWRNMKKLQERHSTSRSDTSRGLISAHPSPVSIEGRLIGMGIGEWNGGSGMNGTGIGDGFWGRWVLNWKQSGEIECPTRSAAVRKKAGQSS